MAKKSKKKKNTAYNKPSRLRFGNTITVTLLTVMLIMVGGIIAITFAYSVDIVKAAQTNTRTDLYKSFQIFNNIKQTPQEFEAILPSLRTYLNNILAPEYAVKDIFVTDESDKPVYTTLNRNKGDDFIFKGQNSQTPLKVIRASDYRAENYSAVAVHKTFADKKYAKSYYVYLIVPNPSSVYKTQMIDFSRNFFLIVLVICTIFILLLAKSITKPLKIMENTVSQIAKGDLSGRLDLTKYDEINRLVGSYNMMANALQRLYSSLEAQVNDRTRELKGAYAELKSTQAMMVHSEKMKSLGELVAGIMHEINNPINFIYGNMTHLGNYSKDLINVIDEYTKYEASLKEGEKSAIDNLKQECDYEFLKTDMPDLIRSCKEGAERAKNIIQDLKSFSRMEEVTIKDVNLPVEIDTVLNILHNKIKNKATVHKEYMEDVPKVEAFGGQLNQVFMNILDNAVGAIEKTGDIWIRINTDESKNNIVVEVEDNGSGMDEETARKVFDPFFTTKPVGQGTGLGLSITYKIIKNHQGDIKVSTTKGVGTKFIITLPLNIDRENLKDGIASGENDG